MESLRVCVIDSSPAVRETLAIILSDGYAVDCLSPEEFRRDPSRFDACHALVVGDDCARGELGALLPVGTPVLWLRAGAEPLPFERRRSASVPRTFDPQELRSTLQSLLASGAADHMELEAQLSVDYPIIPKEAALLARRAGLTNLPVLLCGDVGTGKARLARAIHALGPVGRFVPLAASSCIRAAVVQAAALGAGNVTLFVSDLAEINAEGQHVLRELLDCGGLPSDAGWHPVRLICATTRAFEELARLATLSKDLFYRLGVLPITLPRLRERTTDMTPLVYHLSSELTRALSLPPVSFTPRAMERLERYLWFGNLAELETVLTRTIAIVRTETIDAPNLLFGYGRLIPQPSDIGAPGPPASPRKPSSSETVDLVINELAHEFKNPMVMIKTVSQHLEQLLADDDGREQVTRLTGEAVARMDRALENLLQFTRFRAPAPERITLNALLAPCLSELTPLLTERRLLLNYHPPHIAKIFVDPAQLAYAFDNLLRVLVRDLGEGSTLTIRAVDAPTAVIFEYTSPYRSTAAQLAALLDHPANGDDSAAPLGLVFARALVERNGGHLDVTTTGERTAVTVWLPNQETVTSEHGKMASSHS